MNIGVIADLHGNLEGWRRAWELLQGCDLLCCSGDLLYHGPRFDPAPGYDPRALAEALSACPVPLLIARGNADSEVDALFIHHPIQAPYALAMVEGARILVAHGHLEPEARLVELAQGWGVDFLLTGHTHSPHITRHGGLVHMNPGTATYPLAQDDRLRRPTCGRIVDGAAEVLDLVSGEVLLR